MGVVIEREVKKWEGKGEKPESARGVTGFASWTEARRAEGEGPALGRWLAPRARREQGGPEFTAVAIGELRQVGRVRYSRSWQMKSRDSFIGHLRIVTRPRSVIAISLASFLSLPHSRNASAPHPFLKQKEKEDVHEPHAQCCHIRPPFFFFKRASVTGTFFPFSLFLAYLRLFIKGAIYCI
jgi:hypothetical protein